MDAFWRRGFAETSVRHLERATGLKAPSLYNAFGSKDALYLRALELYVDLVGERFASPMESAEADLDTARGFFEALDEGMRSAEARPGCLAIHTNLGDFPSDDAARLVSHYANRFRAAFANCTRALPMGDHAAETLWLMTVGLNQLHRTHGVGADLQRAFAGVYAYLDLLAS